MEVIEGADEIEGGHFRERIDEGGLVSGHDVQIAGIRSHEGEETRAIYPFPQGEHAIQVGLAVDDEIEFLEAAIAAHVPEIEHPDVVSLDEPDDVLLREIFGGFTQTPDDLVRVQGNGLVHGFTSWLESRKSDIEVSMGSACFTLCMIRYPSLGEDAYGLVGSLCQRFSPEEGAP